MDITKLLCPNRICIVGATEKDGFGGDACRNAMAYMDKEDYFFVNPRRTEVFGVRAYPSMRDVPKPFDLAVICTPMKTVEGLLEEAKACGAAAAVVFASGYKETGDAEGLAAQNSLIAKAKELDMAVMGPNCAGFINCVSKIHAFAFVSNYSTAKGNVGFVSQSGQLCMSMMECSGLDFSCCVSAGNAAVVTMEDYLDYMVDDPNTKVVALYVEGIRDPRRFAAALQRAALNRKPVVILKTGRSEKGRTVAASHTGSLSGSDKFFDALLRKFGAIRVDDLEELIAMTKMLAVMKVLPATDSIASISLSGGETGICADMGSELGINYPNFLDSTRDALKAMLPGYASVNNPLDITATLSYDTELFAKALRIISSDPNISLIMIGYTLLENVTDTAIYHMADAIQLVSTDPGAKPVVMLPFAESTRNKEITDKLAACGVPILPPPAYGLRLVRKLCDYIQFDISRMDTSLSLPERPRKPERFSLSEHDGKKVLNRYGIPVTKEILVSRLEDVPAAAANIGFPLVMKISSPDILHKSDCGGVMLNIGSVEEAKAAYKTILDNAKKFKPEAMIEGILLQSMVFGDAELLVGISTDPQWGSSIMVGFGGIYVELFKDVSMCLAPVSEYEARNMIDSLTARKLLEGYRGKKKLDKESLAQLLVAVSRMAASLKNNLVEMDINPVILNEKGACAADSVIVSDEPLD